MIYIVALVVMQLISITLVFREFRQGFLFGPPSAPGRVRPVWRSAILLLPVSVLAAPIAIELFKMSLFMQGSTVALTGENLDMWLTIAGGALAVAVFGVRLWCHRHAGPTFTGAGEHVLGIVIGAYMLGAGIDELHFLGNGADAGAADLAFFREHGVSDIKCSKALILVRRDASGPARYRCPTSVVVGQFSTAPLIPWPDYSEGTSIQLATALRRLESATATVPTLSVAGVHKP